MEDQSEEEEGDVRDGIGRMFSLVVGSVY